MEHAKLLKGNTGLSNDHILTYHLGQMLTYVCDDGYRLKSGELNRMCGMDGNWNGTSPECGMPTPFVCEFN